jgi:hydrogenase maturation protease
MTSILVACVGNIFKSDDGFGVEVAAELARRRLPDQVRLVDFGIRSVHLVYELMSGYDVLVLVDTVAQQEGAPGSLYLIEPEIEVPQHDDPLPEVMLDAHDLSPGGVLALMPSVGGQVERILVVGVQPLTLDDGIGLSDAVRLAVRPAADLVVDTVERELLRLQRLHAVPTKKEVEG